MKKKYISPSCLVTEIYVEQVMLSGSINVEEDGSRLGDALTNKKGTGFAGSMSDNMGETGNF